RSCCARSSARRRPTLRTPRCAGPPAPAGPRAGRGGSRAAAPARTRARVRVSPLAGVEKATRALAIEKAELEKVRKDLEDQRRILEEDLFERVRSAMLGKAAEAGPKKIKPGPQIDEVYLADLPREQWLEIRLQDEEGNAAVERAAERLK